MSGTWCGGGTEKLLEEQAAGLFQTCPGPAFTFLLYLSASKHSHGLPSTSQASTDKAVNYYTESTGGSVCLKTLPDGLRAF